MICSIFIIYEKWTVTFCIGCTFTIWGESVFKFDIGSAFIIYGKWIFTFCIGQIFTIWGESVFTIWASKGINI